MPRADLLAARPRRSARRPWAILSAAAVVAALVGSFLPAARRALVGEADEPPTFASVQDASSVPPPAPRLRVRPLAQWLDEVASEAGMGLVVAPELDAEIAAVFPPSTAWEARLDALARIGAFSYRIGTGMIEVGLPPSDVPEAASLPTVVARGPASGSDQAADEPDDGRAEPAASTPVEPVRTPAETPRAIARVVRLVNARAVEVEPVLYDTIGAADVRVAADASSNALVLAGLPDDVAAMERIARALDLPKRSFLLEAQIVEIKRGSREERGIEWLLESGDVGGLVDFPAADVPGEQSGVVVATSGSHSLRARISALAASGRARVVSRPRVIVVEGKPASIESVRVLRVRVPERGAVVADGDDIAVSSDGRAVEEIPVGVSLVVEPAMQGQGRIVLRIRAESSTLGPPLPPDDIPEELSRVVDAEIVLGDGETAVLGGLRREARSESGTGVPVLRSIPILGLLFGRRRDEHDGEELVVLVTPRLLD